MKRNSNGHSVLFSFIILLTAAYAGSTFAVELEQSMPEDQRRLIESDFQKLERFDVKESATPALLSLFGHAEIRTRDLTEWLEERVKIILPETWDSRAAMQTPVFGAQYPNSDELNLADQLIDFPVNNAKSAVNSTANSEPALVPILIMENIGLKLYLTGKGSNMGLTFQINGRDRPVLSPRSGLIRIGSGLFNPSMNPSADPEAMANSVSRLASIFHEGRHSDGNGKSLGFQHVACPAGHPLAERSSCDSSRNGAYTVDAEINRLLLIQCTQCSTAEKDVIRAQIADSYSRVIQVSFEVDAGGSLRKISAPELDAAPEMRSL